MAADSPSVDEYAFWSIPVREATALGSWNGLSVLIRGFSKFGYLNRRFKWIDALRGNEFLWCRTAEAWWSSAINDAGSRCEFYNFTSTGWVFWHARFYLAIILFSGCRRDFVVGSKWISKQQVGPHQRFITQPKHIEHSRNAEGVDGIVNTFKLEFRVAIFFLRR